ncbi:DUF1385 domain-containing protein [Helcococcus kunzii]|uniref:DUF1385 domain-containing protein n=1 Tax=Helcococcus kunzii TaxID=40091 RepID=UPI0021A607A1|nr:DUF1385 domain-containing protein [Helcococcus kunzii]MCT1796245.1 DUF1385 domain-containing protein [Helcococcus kunzii]MCT1988900.1 DUF1385 domain-containing protein [Helcococcus kunzii]
MSKEIKKTTIGGQALYEGILMKGPDQTSIVVRKPNGELEKKIIDRFEITNKYSIFKYPFFRGIGAFIDAIKNGTKAIDYSLSFSEEEEKKQSKLSEIFYSILSFLIFAGFLLLFFYVPTWFSNLFKDKISSVFVLNLIEGLVRIVFFLLYVMGIAQLKDIKRVFEYHGAEHKTIACYEYGEELTVENVRKHSKLHPRCGTSFMFNMVIISAFVLAFFGWPNPIVRVITRILIIPLLMGITYELNRWMGKSDSFLAKILAKPGMFVQYIGTVKEPTDDMIEVAIEAMKMVIPEDNSDEW